MPQRRVGASTGLGGFLGFPQDNTHVLRHLPLLPFVHSVLVIGEVVNGSTPTKTALVLGEGRGAEPQGTQPEVLRG